MSTNEVNNGEVKILDKDEIIMATIHQVQLLAWFIVVREMKLKEDRASILNQIKDLGTMIQRSLAHMMSDDEKESDT